MGSLLNLKIILIWAKNAITAASRCLICQFQQSQIHNVFITLPVVASMGCSASHYRKDAEKDAYNIISDVEKEVFGSSSPFTIDTRFSDKAPEEVLSSNLIDESKSGELLNLTLDKALTLAVDNNRTYQTRKEQLFLTALNLTESQRQFEDNWFSRFFGRNSRNPNGDRNGSSGADLGFNKALKSGGALGLTIANDLLKFYTGNPRRSAVSTISFNLTKPLLRGNGRKIVGENLTQAERNVVYAVRDYSQFQKEFAVDIVNFYFQLLQDKDFIRNNYANYVARTASTQRTLAFYEVQEETIVSVGQDQQAELSAKNSYINQVAQYQNRLDQFKILLGIPVTTTLVLEDKPLRDLKSRGLMEFSLTDTDGFEFAIENQLILMNDIDRFEDSKRKIAVAANQLKADLNILADGSLQSDGPTDYTDFNIDDVRWNYGIELNLPIDRLRERNAYRSTLINFESAIRTLSLSLDEKQREVEVGLRTLKQIFRNYEIALAGLQAAEQQVESAQLLRAAGDITQRDLRDALDALVNQQNNVTNNIVNYLTARLQLMLDIGALDTDMKEFWVSSDAMLIPDEFKNGPLIPDSEAGELQTPEEIFAVSIKSSPQTDAASKNNQ